MSAYIVPGIVIALIVYASIKKVNCYTSFVFGAKSSFDLVITSFPYIVAIFIAIEIFIVSGLSTTLSNFVSPTFSLFGIPSELTELILIKPFSGSGSIVLLENIYKTYGVDSYLARVASVIAGSSEAVFFVCAVFFSKTKIEKFSYGIPVALLANFVGVVIAAHLCRIM